MLVITRKKDEEIFIGKDIRVVVVQIRGDKVRLGVDAPKSVLVDRPEVRESRIRNGEIDGPAASNPVDLGRDDENSVV